MHSPKLILQMFVQLDSDLTLISDVQLCMATHRLLQSFHLITATACTVCAGI